MATVTAPTISKRQFVTYFSMIASFGTTALTMFDPSIHLSASAKGFVASAAVTIGGIVAGWYQHSSHKLEIAKIAGDASKIVAGVRSVNPPA